MVKIYGTWLPAGLAVAVLALTGSSGPAQAQCIKKHPIFGVDVYMEDKYCPKKVEKKKARVKTPGNTRDVTARRSPERTVAARQVAAPKPEKRIMEMQTMLTRAGYNPGPADGLDGPMTRKAAGEFNTAHGLPEKASTGSTNAVLRHLLAPKPDKRLMNMQSMLLSMGYNPGSVDGFGSPETSKAAAEFNLANDLPKKASISSTIAVLAALMGKS